MDFDLLPRVIGFALPWDQMIVAKEILKVERRDIAFCKRFPQTAPTDDAWFLLDE